MKKFQGWILLPFLLLSCNKDTEEIPEIPQNVYWYQDEVYSQIEDSGEVQEVFKSYLKAFILDAQRHGVDLSHVNIENSRLDLTTTDIIGSNGYCDPNRAQLVWNVNHWNTNKLQKVGEPIKIYLMWHELGHDLLGLDHICKSGHIMTGRHTPCKGDGNEGDEINLYGLRYNTVEDIRSFKRAVDDMFAMFEQYHMDCRNSFSSKGAIGTLSCDLNY